MDMQDKVTLQEVLCEIAPREALCQSVLLHIAQARRRAARIRLALQSLMCFALGASLVPLAEYTGRELFNSGFYEYSSMIFSDRAYSTVPWQDVSYSLIESLPALAILLVAACSVLLIWSARNVVRSGRVVFMTS
jgi:hypothetical protein